VKPAALAIAGLAAAAGLVAFAHRQAIAANQAAELELAPADMSISSSSSWNSVDLWGMTMDQIEANQVQQAIHDTTPAGDNLTAFQALIDFSEGTSRGGRDPYRTCYGYAHTIASFADHPAITGEWRGEPIDELGPQYAGMVSTAAGRYQIRKATWLECKRALGLVDFSPASQDAACAYLIKRRSALEDVQAGRVEIAVAKCKSEWASLPGNAAGQPQRKLEQLLAAYTNAGGALA